MAQFSWQNEASISVQVLSKSFGIQERDTLSTENQVSACINLSIAEYLILTNYEPESARDSQNGRDFLRSNKKPIEGCLAGDLNLSYDWRHFGLDRQSTSNQVTMENYPEGKKLHNPRLQQTRHKFFYEI